MKKKKEPTLGSFGLERLHLLADQVGDGGQTTAVPESALDAVYSLNGPAIVQAIVRPWGRSLTDVSDGHALPTADEDQLQRWSRVTHEATSLISSLGRLHSYISHDSSSLKSGSPNKLLAILYAKNVYLSREKNN